LIKILKIFSHFPFALELCRGLNINGSIGLS
jgi:hypothetical protein